MDVARRAGRKEENHRGLLLHLAQVAERGALAQLGLTLLPGAIAELKRSVLTGPGATAFTRMPSGPTSWARCRVNPMTLASRPSNLIPASSVAVAGLSPRGTALAP